MNPPHSPLPYRDFPVNFNRDTHTYSPPLSGAEIDARNLKLETPLLLAVSNLRNGVTDSLIKNGADVNAFSKDEITCLHLAAEKGSVDLINKLFNSYSYKLDLNPRNRVSFIYPRNTSD